MAIKAQSRVLIHCVNSSSVITLTERLIAGTHYEIQVRRHLACSCGPFLVEVYQHSEWISIIKNAVSAANWWPSSAQYTRNPRVLAWISEEILKIYPASIVDIILFPVLRKRQRAPTKLSTKIDPYNLVVGDFIIAQDPTVQSSGSIA